MSWSRAELNQTKLKVCESDGAAVISIHRYGNLKSSSFVSLTVKPGSAKLNVDIAPQTALQVQFDPSTSLWKATLTSDVPK